MFVVLTRLRVQVTIIAGSGEWGQGDGDASKATFSNLGGITVAPDGSLYVSDFNRLRRIKAGRVETLAGASEEDFVDGIAATARFRQPKQLSANKHGEVFIADSHNNRIRKYNEEGQIVTAAGTGARGYSNGTSASFNRPHGVACDPSSGNVYIADTYSRKLRVLSGTAVRTLVGDDQGHAPPGAGLEVQIGNPIHVAVSPNGECIYMAESNRVTVLRDGAVSVVAEGGDLQQVCGIAVSASGLVYVTSSYMHIDGNYMGWRGAIRVIDTTLSPATVSTLDCQMENSSPGSPVFMALAGLALDEAAGILYATDEYRIKAIKLAR